MRGGGGGVVQKLIEAGIAVGMYGKCHCQLIVKDTDVRGYRELYSV